MKKQFLRALNQELRPLKKKERKKYLNNYEEAILDKMENGVTEERAVPELDNVKHIAMGILNSYVVVNGQMINGCEKYFNKIYIVIDAIVLIVSYILAYFLRFKSGMFEMNAWHLSFSVYITALIFILPSYFLTYYMHKLYTVQCVKQQSLEVWNIFKANTIGFFIFILILYLTGQHHFSRSMVCVFVCFNIGLDILVRNIVFNRFKKYNDNHKLK